MPYHHTPSRRKAVVATACSSGGLLLGNLKFGLPGRPATHPGPGCTMREAHPSPLTQTPTHTPDLLPGSETPVMPLSLPLAPFRGVPSSTFLLPLLVRSFSLASIHPSHLFSSFPSVHDIRYYPYLLGEESEPSEEESQVPTRVCLLINYVISPSTPFRSQPQHRSLEFHASLSSFSTGIFSNPQFSKSAVPCLCLCEEVVPLATTIPSHPDCRSCLGALSRPQQPRSTTATILRPSDHKIKQPTPNCQLFGPSRLSFLQNHFGTARRVKSRSTGFCRNLHWPAAPATSARLPDSNTLPQAAW